ncbi:hypothetical protein CN907_01935 [Bacillus anthracis]|uniref:Uncharacterized protein n=1 Tax=Bacillus fungorum TaxID=2039284 RepID=A0A2G6QCK9_9BACI|nr:hypothetical protein CN907_01935 [Bacillus anthracis]PIE94558.1 hypothetical protein CO726_14870 [Bacillus fungorum]
MLVEFFLQQCSKTHPHHSLLYIFLLLFYMKFHYFATSSKMNYIQFFLNFIYKEIFSHLICISFSYAVCIVAFLY